jgi:hypothetical protein
MCKRLGLEKFYRRVFYCALMFASSLSWGAVTLVSSSVPSPPSNAVSSLQIPSPTGLAVNDVMLAYIAQKGGGVIPLSVAAIRKAVAMAAAAHRPAGPSCSTKTMEATSPWWSTTRWQPPAI